VTDIDSIVLPHGLRAHYITRDQLAAQRGDQPAKPELPPPTPAERRAVAAARSRARDPQDDPS
jgi:hypothetical protein